MDVNAPLHGTVHFWIIMVLVSVGYLMFFVNQVWAECHRINRRVTNGVLFFMLLVYGAVYCYVCLLYRTPMKEAHVRLEPFWSYRAAFEGFFSIKRLGVARSICLNILLFVPLGYLMPAVFRNSSHRYLISFLLIFIVSAGTEAIQYFTKTGLCEVDDVINNLLGGLVGMMVYAMGRAVVKYMKQGES